MPVFYRKDMMPMSQFSELLREYIKKKDITIKALAEKCGIDRTYLHKILKGERKVPSVDFVENISLQLMLSTEDKSRLMELYNISEMEEDVYNRRKQVSKIIHDMANTNMEDPDALTFKTEVDIDSVPEISIYTDKRELRKNLQVLICSDVHNGSDIQVIAQPTEFLTNLLSIAAEGSESAINHLFFFDNTSYEKNTAKYNLDIFPFICHLAQKHEKYEAFYYYEGASADFNSTNIMPIIIIARALYTDLSLWLNFICGSLKSSRQNVQSFSTTPWIFWNMFTFGTMTTQISSAWIFSLAPCFVLQRIYTTPMHFCQLTQRNL